MSILVRALIQVIKVGLSFLKRILKVLIMNITREIFLVGSHINVTYKLIHKN